MGVSWHRDAGPHTGKNPKVGSQCSQKLKPPRLPAPLGMDDEFQEEDKRMSSRDSRGQRAFIWLTDGSHSTQVFLFSSVKRAAPFHPDSEGVSERTGRRSGCSGTPCNPSTQEVEAVRLCSQTNLRVSHVNAGCRFVSVSADLHQP